MGELWVQWFTCCWNEQPQPTKRRRRIDRSMIGEPTNFRHTGHIGSGDMQTGAPHLSSSLQYEKLAAIQNQMRSKGGYEYAVPVNVPIAVGGPQN